MSKPKRRPEHVKCVADVNGPTMAYRGKQIPVRAVCGEYIVYSFHFVSWEHADGTVAQGSRMTVCPQCAEKRAAPPTSG